MRRFTVIVALTSACPGPDPEPPDTTPDDTAETGDTDTGDTDTDTGDTDTDSGDTDTDTDTGDTDTDTDTDTDPVGLALTVETVDDRTARPVDAVTAPDGTLYVVGLGGLVRSRGADGAPGADLVDLVGAVARNGGEQGLLGLALHPSFSDHGRFFVAYTRISDGALIVEERHREPDGTSTSTREVLSVPQPAINHNGGHLEFDLDGTLLVGVGDGGGSYDPLDAGRDTSTRLGKILRIDVDVPSGFGVPADNPLVGVDGAEPAILHWGLRNPWRFHVDRATGDLWVADVGQDRWEEIDVARSGARGLDFGWSDWEGPACLDAPCAPATAPVWAYAHDPHCAITGGFVYRGAAIPELVGQYLYADLCSDALFALDLSGDAPVATEITASLDVALTAPAAVVPDVDGEPLIALHYEDLVVRLVPRAR
jgi:glucose/arabinose dehydrogenase